MYSHSPVHANALTHDLLPPLPPTSASSQPLLPSRLHSRHPSATTATTTTTVTAQNLQRRLRLSVDTSRPVAASLSSARIVAPAPPPPPSAVSMVATPPQSPEVVALSTGQEDDLSHDYIYDHNNGSHHRSAAFNFLVLCHPSPVEEESPVLPAATRRFPIMNVPMEVMDVVFDYCDAQTLCQLQLTCRSMRSIIRPLLWNEVHVAFDATIDNSKQYHLGAPRLNYRSAPRWSINITPLKMHKFVHHLKNDKFPYLYWTRQLMIKAPPAGSERTPDVDFLLAYFADANSSLVGLDSLDLWDLTPEWFAHFKPLLDRFASSSKSLHFVAAAPDVDITTLDNLKSLTLAETIPDNLYFAFDLEELNFVASKKIPTQLLFNGLANCSQVKRLVIRAPGLVADKQLKWLPPYVTHYEQLLDEPITTMCAPTTNKGVKTLVTTIPQGRLTQDVVFEELTRLTIIADNSSKISHLSPRLFHDCGSVKQLTIDGLLLQALLHSTEPLVHLESLVCKSGGVDHHQMHSLPHNNLKYLIVRSNEHGVAQVSECADMMMALKPGLRVFMDLSHVFEMSDDVDSDYELAAEWRPVFSGIVNDGFGLYRGDYLYERILI